MNIHSTNEVGAAPEVGQLAEGGEGEEDKGAGMGRRGVERMVDEVGNVSGKAPVVAAVLVQVEDGHRAMAKPAGNQVQGLEKAVGLVEASLSHPAATVSIHKLDIWHNSPKNISLAALLCFPLRLSSAVE